MLSSIVRRSVTRTLHRFFVSVASNNCTLLTSQCRSKNSALQCITLKHNAISHRYTFSTKGDITSFLPLLPGIIHKNRSLMGMLTNIFIEHMTLRPLVDPEFNLSSIVECMKDAACKVSVDLANKNYDALAGLVSEDTLKLLQQRIDLLAEYQRDVIAIDPEDIVNYAPVYIKLNGTSFSEEKQSYSVRVELNLLIFYILGYGRLKRNAGKENGNELINLDELKALKGVIANYVFVRDYTQDGGSDWTIKYINVDNQDTFG